MRRLWLLFPLLALLGALGLLALWLGDPLGAEGVTPEVQDSNLAPLSSKLAVPELGAEPAGREVQAPTETEPDDMEELADEMLDEQHPDPIELGECSLFLEVFESETREPVATEVLIWRLDAPGNEHWKRGDQLQTRVEVDEHGSWVHELPEGRYRARCVVQRQMSDDPVEFVVSGATTSYRLDIDLPGERPLLVQLFRADGRAVERAEFQLARYGISSHVPDGPPWVVDREPKFERGDWGIGMGGRSSGYRRRGWASLSSDAGGWFHIGTVRESSRSMTNNYRFAARVKGDSFAEVSHYFDGDAEELRLISVLFDPEPIQESVVTPEGATCLELEDGLQVTAGALPYVEGDVTPWRKVVLKAWRRWEDDYEDLEFEFTLDDLPLPTRVLEPKPRKQ